LGDRLGGCRKRPANPAFLKEISEHEYQYATNHCGPNIKQTDQNVGRVEQCHPRHIGYAYIQAMDVGIPNRLRKPFDKIIQANRCHKQNDHRLCNQRA
jgi:hypothetical protein